MKIINTLIQYITKGDSRMTESIKNIIVMIILKGVSILIGFLLVPVTIDYVDSETYGIWLTLSSIVAWFSFFDIGLNNGLKNRLTEAIAKGDLYLGKKYVSTTYAMLVMIFIPLMLILTALVQICDWNSILNIHSIDEKILVSAMLIIVVYFCVNFILSTVNIVLLADQKPAAASFRTVVQQLISFIIILVLTKTTHGDLLKLCFGLCVSTLVVNIVFNYSLFRKKYKCISPSLNTIDFNCLPDLVKLGGMFFIIQVAGIIQFQLVNFLMIRHFGPNDVTEYNIAHKLFNAIYMCWSIVIAPLWANVTDAKTKGEWNWIQNAKIKYSKLFNIFLLLGCLVFAFSGIIFKIWIGNSVHIGLNMSLCVFVNTIVLMFGSLYVNILNGLGELKVQTITCLFSPFVFLGVTYLCLYLQMGPCSIIIGSIVANFNGYLVAPLQCNKILRRFI